MLQAPQHEHILIMKIVVRSFEDRLFCWFLLNNSTTEHDIAELITPLRSVSSAHYIDINISKLPKINENPLIIDLAFHQNFVIFAIFLKH